MMQDTAVPGGWGPDGQTNRFVVDEGATLRLTTVAVDVYLTTAEAEDPHLAAAQSMLARAADIVARVEDAIVFNGRQLDPEDPAGRRLQPPRIPGIGLVQPQVYSVTGGDANDGLLGAAAPNLNQLRAVATSDQGGEAIFRAIIGAIQGLEAQGHYGPFACVLGRDLYEASVTPNQGSFVLPMDRILPFLNGPLLRSSALPVDSGVVVGGAGTPVDLVVGTDIHVSYVQMSVEPRYVLRVSEKFVLRIKQPEAVSLIQDAPPPPPPVVPPPPAPPAEELPPPPRPRRRSPRSS
jgi:uncharacterized linocin/CFP29 family protein